MITVEPRALAGVVGALLAGCTAPFVAAPSACPPDAPCAPTLADGRVPAQASVLIANVFDAPVFEVYASFEGGVDGAGPAIHRLVTADPFAWPAPGAAVIAGDHPAAAYLPDEEGWRMCRRWMAEIVCATSHDGSAWRDTEAVWPRDGSVAPRWPVGLVAWEGAPLLFVYADRRGEGAIFAARHDGATAFVLDELPLVWEGEARILAASARAGASGLEVVVVRGGEVLALRSTDARTWETSPVDGPTEEADTAADSGGADTAEPALAGTLWIAAAEHYGAAWVWRGP